MAQTFDIRFDAAGNSFGWKGGGLLRIDGQGLSFALKRGIASLLARRKSQRIPADKIREVYREGEVLRVEFATDEIPRATLPFRVRDRDTAAHIMQLLPTSRTVEVDDGPVDPRGNPTHPAWIGPVAIVLVLAAAVWVVGLKRPGEKTVVAATGDSAVVAPVVPVASVAPVAPRPKSRSGAAIDTATIDPPDDDVLTPEQARRAAIVYGTPPPSPDTPTASTSAPVPRSGPPAVARADTETEPDVEGFVPMEVPDIDVRADQRVVRIAPTTLVYGTARGMLNTFEADAAVLTEGYRNERQRFDRGTLDVRAFANRLDALELRWQSLSERILGNRKYEDAGLAGLRATLLNVVIEQRVFLGSYAAGLRTEDQPRIDRAFKALERADESMKRARNYVN